MKINDYNNNSNDLKKSLQSGQTNHLDDYQYDDWTKENVYLFYTLYHNKKIYLIPEVLLKNAYLLSIFIKEKEDCYEFQKEAWTKENTEDFLKENEISYIPIGLLDNDYALSIIIEMKKYDIISSFNPKAWTKELIEKYFNEVPNEFFDLNEEMLDNQNCIINIIKRGLVKKYIFNLENIEPTEDVIEEYIKYLKKTNDLHLCFIHSTNLLKRIIKEKMEDYYSLFADDAWDQECIEYICNNISTISGNIPNKLKNNSLILKYVLLNNPYFDYDFFEQSAWNEENVKIFEENIINFNYKYDLPACFKNKTDILEFFIKNEQTQYFDFFYNETWNEKNINLFITLFISTNKVKDIPFNLKYNEKILKFILLYDKEEYYDEFTIEAWNEENVGIIEEKIKNGISTEKIPSILKTNGDFLNFVLDNEITELFDYFKEISDNDEEAEKFFKIFINNPNIQLPHWFLSSSRGLQLFIESNRLEYIKFFDEKAWNKDNMKQYILSIPNNKKIIFYQSMFRSEKVLDYILDFPEYKSYLVNFSINLWNDEKIRKYLRLISESRKITTLLEQSFEQITSQELKKEFIKFLLLNQENLETERIQNFVEIIVNIDNSNSSEIHRLKEELAPFLLESSNPNEVFKMVENIFLSNHLPDVAKKFYVYQIFHRNSLEKLPETISPVLQKYKKNRDFIILSDLLNITLKSNNNSLRNYLIRLNKGQNILMAVNNNNELINNLSYENYKILEDYIKNICLLYNSASYSKNAKYELTNDMVKDINNLLRLLKTDTSSLLDRIIRMYFGLIGINTYEELIDKIVEVPIKATKKSVKLSQEQLILKKGDFIKGINDIKFLENILNNGSVASEFLGGSATKDGDCTPLDTDLSMIDETKPLNRIFIDQNIQATHYGRTWIVLKNDDRISITRRDKNDLASIDDIVFNNKIEAFSTLGKDHYGIRTGFSSSDIDYIVTEEYNDEIGFIIAKNGFYIPVLNTYGKLIFTKEDYDKIKSQMDGLSHYGVYDYNISPNLEYPNIDSIIKKIYLDENNAKNKRDIIQKRIYDVMNKYGLEMKTEFDGDLSRNMFFFIDIGSTGRGTNLPEESDFDFLLMLDKSIINNQSKMIEITDNLRKALGKNRLDHDDKIINGYDFRFVNLSLDNINNLKVDISFEGKTDALKYSSDMSIKDRFKTINKISPESVIKIRANIIMAKKILKQAHAYKSKLSRTPEGGMSAIGIENWILQHGGSFIDASLDFINKYEEAKKMAEQNGYISKLAIFNNFKRIYKVWNFGENYYSLKKDKIPIHGDFISENMTEDGLEKMANCLINYLLQNNYIKSNEKKGLL